MLLGEWVHRVCGSGLFVGAVLVNSYALRRLDSEAANEAHVALRASARARVGRRINILGYIEYPVH